MDEGNRGKDIEEKVMVKEAGVWRKAGQVCGGKQDRCMEVGQVCGRRCDRCVEAYVVESLALRSDCNVIW